MASPTKAHTCYGKSQLGNRPPAFFRRLPRRSDPEVIGGRSPSRSPLEKSLNPRHHSRRPRSKSGLPLPNREAQHGVRRMLSRFVPAFPEGDIQQLIAAYEPEAGTTESSEPVDHEDSRCVHYHQPILLRGSQVYGVEGSDRRWRTIVSPSCRVWAPPPPSVWGERAAPAYSRDLEFAWYRRPRGGASVLARRVGGPCVAMPGLCRDCRRHLFSWPPAVCCLVHARPGCDPGSLGRTAALATNGLAAPASVRACLYPCPTVPVSRALPRCRWVRLGVLCASAFGPDISTRPTCYPRPIDTTPPGQGPIHADSRRGARTRGRGARGPSADGRSGPGVFLGFRQGIYERG